MVFRVRVSGAERNNAAQTGRDKSRPYECRLFPAGGGITGSRGWLMVTNMLLLCDMEGLQDAGNGVPTGGWFLPVQEMV